LFEQFLTVSYNLFVKFIFLYDGMPPLVLLAHNLFKKLGLGIKLDVLNYMVTLKEVLVLADQKCPPDLNSEDNIDIFCRMVSRQRNGIAAPVKASHIINFLAGVQNVPPSESEANLLLTRMVEYDDCSTDPTVEAVIFKKEVGIY
jgi:hypothetical protein